MADDAGAPFRAALTAADLGQHYRPPLPEIAAKKMTTIEPWLRAFIEVAPFVLIATADAQGRPTVSPKGGDPGFVAVLDDRRLAIPDYPGNNLIDGLRNLVVNPAVGLIFLVPGRGETIRVDGSAWVTTDPEVLAAVATGTRRAKVAIGVEVRSAFLHCSSSFERAGLWSPETWRDDSDGSFIDFVRNELEPEELPDWARP